MLKDALGAYRGTAREITRIIEHEPGNADAYCSRAHARGAGGDTEGAIGDYTMAMKLGLRYRECTTAYGNRGLLRFESGDYEGAIEDFSKVIERRPGQKGLLRAALLQRGRAREKMGDRDGAAADRRLAALLSNGL